MVYSLGWSRDQGVQSKVCGSGFRGAWGIGFRYAGPLPSDLEHNTAAKARFWPWLEPFSGKSLESSVVVWFSLGRGGGRRGTSRFVVLATVRG